MRKQKRDVCAEVGLFRHNYLSFVNLVRKLAQNANIEQIGIFDISMRAQNNYKFALFKVFAKCLSVAWEPLLCLHALTTNFNNTQGHTVRKKKR